MSTHYDDPHGDLLARALRAEAESIVPAGDGLTKIRGRVEQRRARFRWLIPSASVVTAAALGGIAFGAYSVSNHDDSLTTDRPAHSQTASGGPTASAHPTASSSASASTPPGGQTVTGYQGDVTPVWPFRSAAEVTAWQHSGNAPGEPWRLSAPLTARSFLHQLALPNERYVVVQDTASGHVSGDVTLATSGVAGQQRVVGTVHLVRWGSGTRVPWEVTGVDSTGARIDSPSNSASVSSPVTVRYTLDGGAEDDVTVSVYDGWNRIGTRTDSAGGGQHTATLGYQTPTGSAGYVVVADAQSASGTAKLQRLVVTPVRFSSPTVVASGPPSTQKYPGYFVAVKDGRLAVFYAKGGGFARWLTGTSHDATDPRLDGSRTWVYYLQDPNHLVRVKTTGGSPEAVVTGEFSIDAFAVGSGSDDPLATVVTSVDTASGQSQMSVQFTRPDGSAGSITMPNPATAEQLAWAPDGRHLAVTVRSGTAWGVRVYDTATAKTADDGVAIPCAAGESCSAPSYDAAGNLYFIQAPDATTWSLMQWTGTEVKHVSTWSLATQASPESATVDITPDAEAAIVGTPAGEIYRIEHGKATLLPTQATQPTW